ncbi:MAG: group II intron reverse transcriptase/maturase [bacterium]|nr:group II intron reverse transcriptase/maturase [bacterium]
MLLNGLCRNLGDPVLNCSYGFRPGRNCHQALAMVDHTLMRNPVNHIIDADIKGFFDHVDHKALKKCLEQRISDRKFLRYIVRFLKSGISEEGKYLTTEKGTPQGGVISPILANIYLHYALDKWFYKVIKEKSLGFVELIRYADDFIIFVRYKRDAEQIVASVKNRLIKCHLELSEEKTQWVKFGRYALKKWRESKKAGTTTTDKPGTFNFLGLTHYCSTSRKGTFKVGRKTENKRYKSKLKKIKQWLMSQKNRMKLKDIWEKTAQMLTGHYRYYGVNENFRQLNNFYEHVKRLLYKWLNRRSQKKSFTWEKFKKYQERYPLPRPKLYHNLYSLALIICRQQRRRAVCGKTASTVL